MTTFLVLFDILFIIVFPYNGHMLLLGIETSCDETATALVEDGTHVRSTVIASSIASFENMGGVIPEQAARRQVEYMLPTLEECLRGTGVLPDELDAIAVTRGPGLLGSLLVGTTTARTLGMLWGKPVVGVHHTLGHLSSTWLDAKPGDLPQFPLLTLSASGGHTELWLRTAHTQGTLLGRTRDDAAGEAFDKGAKLLGLPYPGGPSVSKKAQSGNSQAFDFPKAKVPGKYDFSFSGPKTAVLRAAQAVIGEDYSFPSFKLAERLSEPQKADIAASFQRVAIETVVDKTVKAFEEFQPKSVVIAGGVAASPELRRQLTERIPIAVQYPDLKLCTDNGAMIATLGCYKMQKDQPKADPFTLGIQPNLSM
mgnify:CR=1 FL=1